MLESKQLETDLWEKRNKHGEPKIAPAASLEAVSRLQCREEALNRACSEMHREPRWLESAV